MFRPPWRRQCNPSVGSRPQLHCSRSRTPPGERGGTQSDVKDVALAHANALRASFAPAVRHALDSADADPASLTPRFGNDVIFAVATMNWLRSNAGNAARSVIDWRFAQARMRLRATHTAPQVHRALSIEPAQVPGPWGQAGPTPRANLRLLAQCKEAGGDPAAVLDGVLTSRVAAAFADTTHSTYSSHLNMIGWACDILDAQPIPARLITVQRVAGVINDPSTLRGWLAAWKAAHDMLGQRWAGDLDPRLRMARAGVARLAPPPRPRKRARRQDVIAMVRWALHRDDRRWLIWGGLAAMAYTYGFRVPSELLSQWGAPGGAAFRMSSETDGNICVSYGPYRRKGKLHAGRSTRGCLCNAEPLICPHLWCEAFAEMKINSAEGMGPTEFASKLQQSASAVLTASKLGQATEWTSHCFRRGSAVDILQAQGVTAMMRHGEWAAEGSAHAYASLDEIDTERLRAACVSMIDLSDDDR